MIFHQIHLFTSYVKSPHMYASSFLQLSHSFKCSSTIFLESSLQILSWYRGNKSLIPAESNYWVLNILETLHILSYSCLLGKKKPSRSQGASGKSKARAWFLELSWGRYTPAVFVVLISYFSPFTHIETLKTFCFFIFYWFQDHQNETPAMMSIIYFKILKQRQCDVLHD